MASTITARNFNLTISEVCDLNMQPLTAAYDQTFGSVATLTTNTVLCMSGSETELLSLKAGTAYDPANMQYFAVTNRDNGGANHLRISLSGSELGYVNFKLEKGQKLIFYNNEVANANSGSTGDPATGNKHFMYRTWDKVIAVASGSTIYAQTVYAATAAG
tara:strand:- start:264 stop:746 length:483 start_codon:yes stop_codon:yes gene_type:complete